MPGFDYGAYFGPILPLADTLREGETRCWGDGAERDKSRHDYVLYLGCNVLRTVALAETIVAILRQMGVDFVALGGPATCCGIIHHGNGDADISEKLTRQTLAKFEGYRPKAVLTYCPSCHTHMDYALAQQRTGFDIPYLHVTEFIVERLDRLRFVNRIEQRVFLHAHGNVAQAEKDAAFARAILTAIPGLEVVGDPGAADWGRDCGTREIARIGGPRHAALVDGLFATARAAGAGAVAAVYHSCYRTLCARQATEAIEVVHYTGLVAEALGIGSRHEPFKALRLQADPDGAFARLKDRAAARGVTPERLRRTLDAHFAKH